MFDRFIAYLLVVFLLIITWNESLSSRVRRVLDMEKTPQAAANAEFDSGSATAPEAPPEAQPKTTPFWQNPNYHNTLEPEKAKKKTPR